MTAPALSAADYSDWCRYAGLYLHNVSHADRYRTFQGKISAAGLAVKVATYPLSKVARALEVDETQGFLKAVVDAESGKILGAAVLGLEGGELVTLLQIAMMGGLHYSALRDGVFSHPTLAESLNNLFMSMDRPAQAV